MAGVGEPGQLPALDAGDVLADGVDLVDGRAAGEQQPGGFLLFREGDVRRGAAAAPRRRRR